MFRYVYIYTICGPFVHAASPAVALFRKAQIYLYVYIYICVCTDTFICIQCVGPLMRGGWVNSHREQQTIPQGETSIPPKSFSTPTANGQSAPRSGGARDVGRGAGSHTPSTASEVCVHAASPAVALFRKARGISSSIATLKWPLATAAWTREGRGGVNPR